MAILLAAVAVEFILVALAELTPVFRFTAQS
jgi:small neutral amino acid transporter SnatA (MarC family)